MDSKIVGILVKVGVVALVAILVYFGLLYFGLIPGKNKVENEVEDVSEQTSNNDVQPEISGNEQSGNKVDENVQSVLDSLDQIYNQTANTNTANAGEYYQENQVQENAPDDGTIKSLNPLISQNQ